MGQVRSHDREQGLGLLGAFVLGVDGCPHGHLGGVEQPVTQPLRRQTVVGVVLLQLLETGGRRLLVTDLAIEPEEAFHRAFRYGEFDVTEISMSSHMMTTARGDNEYVGIPAFIVFRNGRKVGRITPWPGPAAFAEAIERQLALAAA